MKHTMGQFWNMVVQNKVGKIVTLCHSIGLGPDCDAYPYFPDEKNSVLDLQNGLVVVNQIDKPKQDEHTTIRHFQVILKSENKVLMELSHTHFQSWEDWQVPYDDSLTSYIDMVS